MTGREVAPLVSVITPTFNQARFIADCIGSVKAQTYPNWEMIIIDDGSTDDTAAIVEKHQDSRIHYQRQKHVGILALADTYNRALSNSKGDLVSILEGDDLWTAEKLELLVPKFADPEVVLAYGRTIPLVGTRQYPKKTIPGPYHVRNFGLATLFNQPVGAAAVAMVTGGVGAFTFPCAVVMRRSALDSIGGFQFVNNLGAVDVPTFATLSLRGRFEFVDRVVAYWRRYPGAASWIRHREQLIGNRKFARTFLAEHRAELPLTPERSKAIERSWHVHMKRAAFNAGRYLLLQGKWAQAGDEFLSALRSPDPKVVAASVIGYAASLLRKDIEGFMGAAGTVSFRDELAARSLEDIR